MARWSPPCVLVLVVLAACSDGEVEAKAKVELQGTGQPGHGYVCTGEAGEDGTACDDGNPCTFGDACKAGGCVGNELGLLYGGAQADEALALAAAADGGFVLAGSTTSKGAGGSDMWLVRTDAAGHQIWDATFGGPEGDQATAVAVLPDGGLVAAGWQGARLDQGGADMALVRTDLNGKLLWQKTYGGPGVDMAYGLAVVGKTGFALAGMVRATDGAQADVDLARVGADGKLLWDRTYGGPHDDWAHAVRPTQDGGFVLAGFTTPGPGPQSDLWLGRVDHQGTLLWQAAFGGPTHDTAHAVVQLADGGFAAAGFTQSKGKSDVWLVRTDSNGKLLWDKVFGGPDHDAANALVAAADGSLVLAGDTNGKLGGASQSWLLRTDAKGQVLADWTYGAAGTGESFANAVVALPDGGFALAGVTDSNGTSSNDMWLVRTDAQGKSSCP